jgi:hypothetical protein
MGRQGSLTEETDEVAGTGEKVGQERGFGRVGFAKPGGAFDASAGLAGVAAFGVAEAPQAQNPGRRANFEIAGQTNITIGQIQINDHRVAQRRIRFQIGAIRQLEWDRLVRIQDDVGLRTIQATPPTDPFAILALVIVTVEGQQIAVQAERIALGIVAPTKTSEWVVVTGVAARNDGTQGLQFLVDEDEDAIVAFSSVTNDLVDV